MKRLLLILFLFPLFSTAQNQGIIGGNQVVIEEAPFMVSLVDWTPSQFGTPRIPPRFNCGGVLISNKWILTSAHCIENTKNPSLGTTYIYPFDLKIHLASAQRGPTTGVSNQQFAFKVTPDSLHIITSNDHDLALIELTTPLQFNHRQYPIEFASTCNTQPKDYAMGTSVYLPGWGDTMANRTPRPIAVQELRATTSSIIDSITADSVHLAHGFPVGKVNSRMLAFLNNNSTSYVYDSGSPAVLDKNGNKIVLGTASWSYKAGSFFNPREQDSIPTVYNNAIAFESFIRSKTGIAAPSSTLDLYTKDKPWDSGAEPFLTPNPWTSEDIWVRHLNDGIDQHQNPEYSTGANPNYVNVRITNNSCVPSAGNDTLKVYWAKAATALSWPTHWDGNLVVGGQAMGNQVGTVVLPVIQPGDAYIASLSWLPPDPQAFAALYNTNSSVFNANEPHHFCLLSRIVSPSDPMTVVETQSVYSNTRNNNNIAWRNISVVDSISGNLTSGGGGGGVSNDRPVGANVLVGGMGNTNEHFELRFCDEPRAGELNLLEYAEVKITLDDALWQIWEDVQFAGENLDIVNEDLHQVIITNGGCGKMNDLVFSGFDQYLLHSSFNFLVEEISEAEKFHFSIVQANATTGEIIGGESYEVLAPERSSFEANAGADEEIIEGETVTLSAQNIVENAIYNWYNEAGELIYTGENFTVSPEVSQQYKLEVIAEADGFKDYDEIQVEVQEYYIESYSPNPADGFLNVNYEIEASNSAFLMLLNLQTNASSQYMLPQASQSIQLNTANLGSGNYGLILYVNGSVQDYKNVIIQ